MVGLRVAEESPRVADDSHMLRIAVIDLENEVLQASSTSASVAVDRQDIDRWVYEIGLHQCRTLC